MGRTIPSYRFAVVRERRKWNISEEWSRIKTRFWCYKFNYLPPSYHPRGLEDLRSYDFLLSSCLIPLARAISLLVIASISNDFKESLTVLQLIVIIG
jgi:hypothetical protein